MSSISRCSSPRSELELLSQGPYPQLTLQLPSAPNLAVVRSDPIFFPLDFNPSRRREPRNPSLPLSLPPPLYRPSAPPHCLPPEQLRPTIVSGSSGLIQAACTAMMAPKPSVWQSGAGAGLLAASRYIRGTKTTSGCDSELLESWVE